jgi:hypothetical protein
MKKIRFSLALVTPVLAFAIILLSSPNVQAQDTDLYDYGTVWNITFVKIHANMDHNYYKGLSKTWNAAMSEMVKEGILKSYKILTGEAANEDDFNLLLMYELENFAAMDPDEERDAKVEEIEKKVIEAMGHEYDKTIMSYSGMRDIVGIKTMREIHFK